MTSFVNSGLNEHSSVVFHNKLIAYPNALTIESLARREGMRTLQESGLDKLLEVQRVALPR